MVTDAAVRRLVNHRPVPVVRLSQFAGVPHVPTPIRALAIANVALDARGNTYIATSVVGYVWVRGPVLNAVSFRRARIVLGDDD